MERAVSKANVSFLIVEGLEAVAPEDLLCGAREALCTLVTTGPLLKIAKEMVVLDIAPGRDRTATITLADYAEQEMYA